MLFEIGVTPIISPCDQMHFPKIEMVHLNQCLPYRVNGLLMHANNRQEYVTQKYSFYYLHVYNRYYHI